MSSPEGEEGSRENKARVEVELTRCLWMARDRVTVGQYCLFDPAKRHRWGQEPELPMTEVTWFEAVLFCRWLDRHGNEINRVLGQENGLDLRGWRFQLPTEARWGVVGSDAGHAKRDVVDGWLLPAPKSMRFLQRESDEAHSQAAGTANGQDRAPEEVASGISSPRLRIRDRHGNSWEWYVDWYAQETRATPVRTDEPSGVERLQRRGSFWLVARLCHSAYRGGHAPVFGFDVYGFRVVLAPPLNR
jgi:formylglycine-generating enzyme required for sulfatase activity